MGQDEVRGDAGATSSVVDYRPPYITGVADYEAVQVQQYLSDVALTNMTAGMHHTELVQYYEQHIQAMVWKLRTYVLTEKAGEEAEDWIAVKLPLRPWWIPKRLWLKIPTFNATWKIKAEPRWRYPDAQEVHPLGRGVEYVKASRNWRQW